MKHYGYSVAICVCIIAVYVVFYLTGIGCPIKYVTGVSCAGCGMTRACLSALTLDFSAAFYYHPLWILMPPAILLLAFLKLKKCKTAFGAVLVSCAVALVAVYLYRLLFTNSDVVVFDVKNGAVWRLIEYVFT